MKTLKTTLIAMAITLLACVFSQQALAVPILPGTTVVPGAGVFPPVPGTFVTSQASAFNNGVISGTLNTFVYSGNTFGGYTFVYQLNMTGVNPAEVISQLSTGGYLGFFVDITQASFGPGSQDVTNVVRSPSGATLQWQFIPTGSMGAGSLDIGENSFYLIAATDALSFQPLDVAVIDGQSVNVPSFAPAVPEGGSTVAVLGIAVIGLYLLRRRLSTL